MRRYKEISKPFGPRGGWRSVSVQLGLGMVETSAWLDTGYRDSRFEYTFELRVGSYHFNFDWRPSR